MSEVKYSKEVANYGNEHNYVAPQELLVTITLSEFRELVEFKGKYESEMCNLRLEKYKLESEKKELEKKVNSLIMKYEMSEDE